MFFGLSEEDQKGYLERSIVLDEDEVKMYQLQVEQWKRFIKTYSMLDSKDLLEGAMVRLERARKKLEERQENYEKLYGHRYGAKAKKRPAGKPKLTVIRGEKKIDDELSADFRAFLHREAVGDRHEDT